MIEFAPKTFRYVSCCPAKQVVGESSAVALDLTAHPNDNRRAYEPADPRPTPHDTVESLDRLRVIGTLPERERIALIRTVVDGDTAADVAKDLGVSPDRVYTLVHNGSTRVRKRAA